MSKHLATAAGKNLRDASHFTAEPEPSDLLLLFFKMLQRKIKNLVRLLSVFTTLNS